MRRNNPVVICVQALICLFINKNCFIDSLVKYEEQASSIENDKLGCHFNLKESTINRMLLLRKKLTFSFLWVLGGVVVALIFTKSLSIANLSAIKISNILGIFSIMFFSIGTLARLGWEGQSWRGDTIFERLDKYFFWVFYFLGTVLGSASFLL